MSDDLEGLAAREAQRRGRNSRRKGADWEREVVRRLRAAGLVSVRRGIQSRGGDGVPDVLGAPWHVECKSGAAVNVRGALEQAARECGGYPYLVAVHDDAPRPGLRAREWVALPWTVFEELLRAGLARREGL